MGLAAVHSFPVVPHGREQAFPSPRSPQVPRFWSDVQTLGPEESRALLDTTEEIIRKSQVLVDYVDHHRADARRAGVETIAIQLSGILDDGRLDSVRNAILEGLRTGERINISVDGFSKLRRAEHLVAEADRSIAESIDTPISMGSSHGCCGHGYGPSMGSIAFSGPIVLLAVVGAGALLTIAILAIMKKR